MTMVRILRDFKPILDLDLYGEQLPEERITGSKIYLNLFARSTYTRVYMVVLKKYYKDTDTTETHQNYKHSAI